MVIVLFLFFLLPLPAMAERQRIVLDFTDSHMQSRRGEQAAIFLKKELIRQYPGINVSDLLLHKVILTGTSEKGKGLAQLRVGPNSSGVYQVGRQMELANPFRQSWGPWQLLLNGDVKIRKVVLEVENRSRSGKLF